MITLIINVVALIITICNLYKMIVDMIKDSRHEVPTLNMVININCIFIIDTNNDKKGNVIKIN